MGKTVKKIGGALPMVGGAAGLAGGITGQGLGPIGGALAGTAAGTMAGGLLGAGGGGLGGSGYNPNLGAFTPGPQEQEYIAKLQQMAYGQGPSAANLQMRAGLGQATQQASALAASQRGINPALAARLGSMSQANMMQNANQQGAILRAQEQQDAMGMLGQQFQSVRTGQMVGENLRAQSKEAAANRKNQLFGGILGGAGAALPFLGGGKSGGGGSGGGGSGGGFDNTFSQGGQVPGYSAGGIALAAAPFIMEALKKPPTQPMSPVVNPQAAMTIHPENQMSFIGRRLQGMACGGMVENYSDGGKVPGKPVFGGDSPANDTVPAMLSPGEIVIPRSILDHANAPDMAKSFVEGILASKKKDNFQSGGQTRQSSALDGIDWDAARAWNSKSPQIDNKTMSLETMRPSETLGRLFPSMSQDKKEYGVMADVPNSIQSAPAPMPPQPSLQEPISTPQSPLGSSPVMTDPMMQMPQKSQMNQADNNMADINNQISQLGFNYGVEQEKLAQEALQGKIDQGSYTASPETGKNVLNAIGLIMGGLGQGLAGGENQALKFINAQIDRDVQMQAKQMDQKVNLMKANSEIFKDKMSALNASKANLLAITELKIKEEAMKSESALHKMQALKLASELNAQRTAINFQNAASSGKNITPEYAINYLIPKEDKDTATKELGEMKDIQSKLDRVKDVLDQQFKLQKLSSRAMDPIQSKKLLKKSAGDLFPIIKSIVGEKMTKEDAEQMVETNLIGFFDDEKTKDQKISDIQQNLLAAVPGRTPTLSRYGQMYGLDLTKSNAPKSDPLDGKTATGANGERIIRQGGRWVPLGK